MPTWVQVSADETKYKSCIYQVAQVFGETKLLQLKLIFHQASLCVEDRELDMETTTSSLSRVMY